LSSYERMQSGMFLFTDLALC